MSWPAEKLAKARAVLASGQYNGEDISDGMRAKLEAAIAKNEAQAVVQEETSPAGAAASPPTSAAPAPISIGSQEEYNAIRNRIEGADVAMSEEESAQLLEALGNFERSQAQPPRMGETEVFRQEDPIGQEIAVRGFEAPPPIVVEDDDAILTEGGELIERDEPEEDLVNRNEGLLNLTKDERFRAPAGTPGPWHTHQVYFEPSPEKAQEVLMGSAGLQKLLKLPPETKIDKGDENYNRIADAMWIMEAEKATKGGRSLMRFEVQPDKGSFMNKMMGGVLQYAGTPAIQAVLHFDRGATGGLAQNAVAAAAEQVTGQPEAQMLADMREDAPAALAIPSQIAGAVSPGSLPSRMMGAGTKALGMGAPVAGQLVSGGLGSTAGRLAGSGILGAGIAGAESAIQDAGDIAAGTMPAEQFGENIGPSMAWGGAFGVAGEPLGMAASYASRKIRQAMPDITKLRKTGGDVGITGNRLSDDVSKMVDDAQRELEEADQLLTPESQLIDAVEGPMAQAGATTRQEVIDRTSNQSLRYYGSREGQARHSTKPLHDTISDLIKGKKGEEGFDFPWQDTSDLKEGLAAISEGSLVTPGTYPGGRTMTVESARNMLGDEWVDKVFMRSADQTVPPDAMVLVKPARVDAKTIDDVVDGIDAAARESLAQQSRATGSLRRTQEAARRVRDQFKSNEFTGPQGWGALKSKQSQALNQSRDLAQAAGLPTKGKKLSARERQAFRDKVAGFWKGGDRKLADQALTYLADKAGVRKELKDVAGFFAKQRLDKMRSGFDEQRRLTSFVPTRSSVMQGALGPLESMGTAPPGLLRDLPKSVKTLLVSMRRQPRESGVMSPMGGFPFEGATSLRGGAPARAATSDLQNLQIIAEVSAMIEDSMKGEQDDASN